MNSKKERLAAASKRSATVVALALLIAAGGAAGLAEKGTPTVGNAEKQEKRMTTTQSKFYCNIKALTPEERARHKQLNEKLMAARRDIVEIGKGYEFQFSPKDVSLAELAEWTVAESKCCAFFDFHLDLENEGKLLCLRLTGEEGIKAFIRSEFHLPAN
jgi:uncharacterized protein HemX